MINAFQDLGKAFSVVNKEMTLCNTKLNDKFRWNMYLFKQYMAAMETPIGFVGHVGMNVVIYNRKIHTEIGQCLTAYESGDMKTYGYLLGEILGNIFLGYWWAFAPNPTVTPEQALAARFLEGLLKGAINAEGLDNIETCIQDAAVITADTENAVHDFI